MAMHVKAVASTKVDYQALAESGYVDHWTANEGTEPDSVIIDGHPTAEGFIDVRPNPEWNEWVKKHIPTDIDELHEAAGRKCYLSEHRPNPATNTNQTYLGHIIDVAHLSVLGHGHVTLYVKGVSRALLLELERHQQRYSINLSVLSQRYVDHGTQSDIGIVIPPLFNDAQARRLQAAHIVAQARYDMTYKELRDAGHSVKEARGAARAFLPENTETRFFVTGSIRAWRNIIEQRLSDAADAEIREFAREVLKEINSLAPNSVQDLAELHGIGKDE